jgi:stringent starvation protein B
MGEIPTKPYLLRALYEWCVDNGYTPHLAVKVDAQTRVPPEHVRNGEITLNVSPGAVHKLQMGNDLIEFSARFAGAARQLSVPVANVYALYARETGHGMTFEVDLSKTAPQAEAESEPREPPAALPAPADDDQPPPKPPAGKPTLRRVK